MSALQVRVGAANNEGAAPVSEVLEDGLAERREDEMSLTGKPTRRRSNAKNAYDLMSDIKEYILEEPKRVYMGTWLIKGEQEIRDTFDVDGPACGTVGCIAGSALMLAGIPSSASAVWDKASSLLSGSNTNLETEIDSLFLDTEVNADYGTKEYARIVAKRITKFQKKHKDELLVVAVKQRKGRTKSP